MSCGHDYEIEVESNTCWSGSFGKEMILSDRDLISGVGDALVDVSGDNTIGDRYAKVWKTTEDGRLLVKLWKRPRGLTAIFGSDLLAEDMTTEPYGEVIVRGQ